MRNTRETGSARTALHGPRLPKTWRRRCLQGLSPSAQMGICMKNYSCSFFASLQAKAIDSCPGGTRLDPDVSRVVCVLIFTPSLRNAISDFCTQFPLHKNENTSQELTDKSKRSRARSGNQPSHRTAARRFLLPVWWVSQTCRCQKASWRPAVARVHGAVVLLTGVSEHRRQRLNPCASGRKAPNSCSSVGSAASTPGRWPASL